jgi:hypothetical protein
MGHTLGIDQMVDPPAENVEAASEARGDTQAPRK